MPAESETAVSSKLPTSSRRYQTIAELPYSWDISRGRDTASTGGVHVVQVRRSSPAESPYRGAFVYRIVQRNGIHAYQGCSMTAFEAREIGII
jgi:hypothetical protein